MTTFVIVNPQSRGGKTGRNADVILRAVRATVGDVAMAFTTRPGEATLLTREALERGHSRILAVGGDGTTNEVVNGFFRAGEPVNAQATLGLVSSGTGGDFRKTLGIAAGYAESIARLTLAARPVDVGQVFFANPAGAREDRFFLNIASFGLSADVVDRVSRARYTRLLGGPATYLAHALAALVDLRLSRLRVTVDGHTDLVDAMAIGAVCNGRFFGGGMMVAPDAMPDDGLFDVVLLRGSTRLGVIQRMTELYRGAHVAHPSVHVVRGRSVTVASVSNTGAPLRLETDGEGGAHGPAHFTIRPAALLVHY